MLDTLSIIVNSLKRLKPRSYAFSPEQRAISKVGMHSAKQLSIKLQASLRFNTR